MINLVMKPQCFKEKRGPMGGKYLSSLLMLKECYSKQDKVFGRII